MRYSIELLPKLLLCYKYGYNKGYVCLWQCRLNIAAALHAVASSLFGTWINVNQSIELCQDQACTTVTATILLSYYVCTSADNSDYYYHITTIYKNKIICFTCSYEAITLTCTATSCTICKKGIRSSSVVSWELWFQALSFRAFWGCNA